MLHTLRLLPPLHGLLRITADLPIGRPIDASSTAATWPKYGAQPWPARAVLASLGQPPQRSGYRQAQTPPPPVGAATPSEANRPSRPPNPNFWRRPSQDPGPG
eukprot:2745061-Alexandrium_andersonii.AAC.1